MDYVDELRRMIQRTQRTLIESFNNPTYVDNEEDTNPMNVAANTTDQQQQGDDIQHNYIIVGILEEGFFETKEYTDFYAAVGPLAMVEWCHTLPESLVFINRFSYALTINNVEAFKESLRCEEIKLPSKFGISAESPGAFMALVNLFKNRGFETEDGKLSSSSSFTLCHSAIKRVNEFCTQTGKKHLIWKPGYRREKIETVLDKSYGDVEFHHISICPPEELLPYTDEEGRLWEQCIVPGLLIGIWSFFNVGSTKQKKSKSERSWWGLYPYFSMLFLFAHHGIVFQPGSPSYDVEVQQNWNQRQPQTAADRLKVPQFTIYSKMKSEFPLIQQFDLNLDTLKCFGVCSKPVTWKKATVFESNDRGEIISREINGADS